MTNKTARELLQRQHILTLRLVRNLAEVYDFAVEGSSMKAPLPHVSGDDAHLRELIIRKL